MNKTTKEILEYFSEDIPTTLENVKKTGRLLMAKDGIEFRRKMGVSYTTFDILLDMVTEIIPFKKDKWDDFWGVITRPVKIKELSHITGRCETATKGDLKKLEKMSFIKTNPTPHGKIILVRVFPDFAKIVYNEIPDFDRLRKKFEYFTKKGFIKEAQEIFNKMKESIRKTVSKEKELPKQKEEVKKLQDTNLPVEEKSETESKPLTQAEVDEKMDILRKTLGLKEKD